MRLRPALAVLAGTCALVSCTTLRERHEAAIQATVRAMERAPGGARETLEHLGALNGSLAEHDEGDRAVVTDAMLERAASFADKASAKSPDDAPMLLARLGQMWRLARQPAKAEDAYRRSVTARPTLEGLGGLMRVLGERSAFDEVRAVCGEGASALGDDELAPHLQACTRAAHATAGTDAAEWLGEADRARFATWTEKRAAAHAAELQEREAAAARAAERGRKLEVCRASCDEKGAACKTHCTPDKPACAPACVEMAAACRAKCEASVP